MAPKRATDSRAQSVDELIELLDSSFLRALTEPARLELLKVLLRHGPSDVGAIAAHLPQDRSVISRHLKVLHDVGVVRAHSEGRHRIYEVDGQAFLASFEGLLTRVRELAPVCCPAVAQRPVPASREAESARAAPSAPVRGRGAAPRVPG